VRFTAIEFVGKANLLLGLLKGFLFEALPLLFSFMSVAVGRKKRLAFGGYKL